MHTFCLHTLPTNACTSDSHSAEMEYVAAAADTGINAQAALDTKILSACTREIVIANIHT